MPPHVDRFPCEPRLGSSSDRVRLSGFHGAILIDVSPTTQQRLFTPGTGATPPALTGREREQGVLTECLADLLGGTSPPHDVVLTGPRGTGKTVLINWFERACRDHEPDVDVLKLTPADIPTRDALIEILAPSPGIAKLLPRKLGVAAVGSVEWAPPTGGVRNLRAELTARCRRKPLAALLDEAHTLDLEVGRTLLNASQQVRVDAPFLLVLAGTPGLAAHLGAMDVSFWSRLGEGVWASACSAMRPPVPLWSSRWQPTARASTPTPSPRSWNTASAIRTSSNSGARPCGSGFWPPARPG